MSEIDLQKLIIDEPDKFLEFKKFLQLISPESGLLNLNFYLACVDLKKRCSVDSGKSLMRLIRMIYRNYLKSSTVHSASSLAITNQTRKSIRLKIKLMNESNVDHLIFQRATQEVEEFLEKKFIVEFQNHCLLNRINDTRLNSTDMAVDFSRCHGTNVTSNEYDTNFSQRRNFKKSDEFDQNKFHQVLTERLSKLKIPIKDENCSFQSLTEKSNNEFLLKLIQSTRSIDIDIEADALSALDNQYKKIGRFKSCQDVNKDNSDIFSFGSHSIKDSVINSKIPYLWRCQLPNQEPIRSGESEFSAPLMRNIHQCQCHKN